MKEIWLKAILCVQHFCSFGAMLLIVNLLIKMVSTVICVPCMLEHVCYKPFINPVGKNPDLHIFTCLHT